MGLSHPDEFANDDVPFCWGLFPNHRVQDATADQADRPGGYTDGQSLARLKENDILVLLVGVTGSGKTSFMNAATAGKHPVTDEWNLEPCTEKIRAVRYPLRKSNRALVFLDTPGFQHEDIPDNNIKSDVVKSLKQIREKKVRLAGVLYFHRICDNRATDAALEHLLAIQKIGQKTVLQNVLLVTTMWEQVDRKVGESRMQELAEEMWRPLVDRGLALEAFDNTRTSAWNILNKILPSDVIAEMQH